MNYVTQISRYLFIILVVLFALRDYTYFSKKNDDKKRKIENRQLFDIYAFLVFGFVIVFVNTKNAYYLLLMVAMCVYLALTVGLYRLFYPKASMLLVNNMLMLLVIGFVMISRLDISQGFKQFLIAAGATVIAFIIPVIIRKLRVLQKLTWLYAFLGIMCLMVVFALAAVSGGAKLSITIAGVTFQLSEIVKITFVFFVAAKLSSDTSRKSIITATVVAVIHVGILVMSTDLGTALVFFVTYLVMLFVATRNAAWPLAGLGAGCAAAVGSYYIFGHVRKRVAAWKDPFSVYETSGYQIVQGLFAIGAGGWFGTGLCCGSPSSIPVASKDYIFAAICEEFGTIFGICLILVCMSMFLLIVNISMKIKKPFYKMIAMGLGAEYAFQVFLTIGGVMKFIPLTGITLPLVSYGGSSVMSSIIMLAIIQGLYILRNDEEGEELEKKQQNEIECAGKKFRSKNKQKKRS
ncbi:MAG: FtsW/RodA/SpoVE family cell cycle protein [Lachnospiraceae bacterium]|jgi:cell division protein FtsW (lipid II flippase)